ncbi:hypothetical protein B9Q08_04885 [Candidatus Marsarchaeota G2 archaeon ECH_B_SAG-M15]|uniref:Uncharacterized protein n=1 Tax=Candidatus Marsarchaeota G2 archaeon ECH_B_SAG-M15 TaxID=1978162 RepID=A0A2R6AVE3_9ARCH|nr:MAG: hypothetical protein B9Q08_04885 [Candidatus Marsarchaeota G2 archaeon ECH_B_SAG-M15]
MVKLREPLIVDSVSPLDEKINVGAFTLTFRGLLYLLGTLILAYTFYAKHTPAGYVAALATFTVGLTLVFYPPKSQSIETIIILAAAYLAGNTVKTGGNKQPATAAGGGGQTKPKPRPKRETKPGAKGAGGMQAQAKPAGGGERPAPRGGGRTQPQRPQKQKAPSRPPQPQPRIQIQTQTSIQTPSAAPSSTEPADKEEALTPPAGAVVGAGSEKMKAGLGEPPADPAYAKRVEGYVYTEMSTYTASMLRGLASQLFRTQRYREYTGHQPLLEVLQIYVTPLAGLPLAERAPSSGGRGEEVSQR